MSLKSNTKTTNAIVEPLPEKIIHLIAEQRPDLSCLKINHLKRVFGGNARVAWAFDAQWIEKSSGESIKMPCIMLSQTSGGHVDSDALHEFTVLKALSGSGLRTPTAIALDVDGQITGDASVIMQRVEGEANVLNFLSAKNHKASRQMMLDLAEISAGLHQFDWQAAGIEAEDSDPTFFQIDHWHLSYLENRLEPYPLLNELFHWLKKNKPETPRLSIVHGDLRPGNFLYKGDHITALLDWEMAHIGDPAEDIAWIYRPLWSPEKILPLADFLDIYNQHSCLTINMSDVVYYQIFSELKFAAISVSASSSFASGKSTNLRLIDRAAKIPQTIQRSFQLIKTEFPEVDYA